jgi:hypothetical protein
VVLALVLLEGALIAGPAARSKNDGTRSLGTMLVWAFSALAEETGGESKPG